MGSWNWFCMDFLDMGWYINRKAIRGKCSEGYKFGYNLLSGLGYVISLELTCLMIGI